MFYDELHGAVAAARSAACFIRQNMDSVKSTDVQSKAVHDFVTHVDIGAQERIISILNRFFPTYEILAEEQATDSWSANTESFRWIIDPLDGTTNFIHGLPPFAVSIGLQKGDAIVVGVVLEITTLSLFTAVKGGGAFHNGVRINVSSRNDVNDCLLTTGFPYREFEHMEGYLQALDKLMRASRGIRRPGSSSVDLAYLAAGRFDGFFESGLAPWDVAAGVLLVEEAGGRCTDYNGGKDAIFSGQMVASNGMIHDELVACVSNVLV